MTKIQIQDYRAGSSVADMQQELYIKCLANHVRPSTCAPLIFVKLSHCLKR